MRKDPKPQPDLVSGALTYGYPIKVPPGRNGMTPQVGLSYNSQNTTEGSIVGYGWTIDVPSIERTNKTGVDRLYSDNSFSSSLSGELVLIAGTSYGAKIEGGDFLEYTFSGNAWTVKDKRGTMYKFGSTAAGRQSDPADTTKTFKWVLEEMRDTNDNYVKYEYFKDGGQIYPWKIKYTGSGTTDGIFEVEFLRQTRADITRSYQTGFQVATAWRIHEIQTKVSGSWNRKYTLTYGSGDNSKRSILKKITESGRDGSGTVTTLPDMDIGYGAGQASFAQDSSISYPLVTWNDINGNPQTTPFSLTDQYVRLLDADGDGLKDIVKSYNIQVNGVDRPIFWVLRNTGQGWQAASSWTQPTYTYADGQGNSITSRMTFDSTMEVADWNGDGRDDLIRFWAENLGGGLHKQQAVVLLNTGSGWSQDTSVTTSIPTFTDSNGDQQPLYVQSGSSTPAHLFADLNGDGLTDYLYASNAQVGGLDYPRFAVLYNRDRKLVWDSTVAVPWVTFQSGGSPVTTPLTLGGPVQSSDVNGDGLLDFMFATNSQQNGVDNPSFWILINNGHGWTQNPSIAQPTYSYVDQNGAPQTGYFITNSDWRAMDANGDGLSDWVRLWTVNMGNGTTRNDKAILLNTGSGWVQNDASMTVGLYSYADQNGEVQTGYPTTTSSAVMFFDIDADGTDDIVSAGFTESAGVYYPRNWTLRGIRSPTDLASSVTLPGGGGYQFAYQSSATYRDASGNRLNPALSSVIRTVRTISSDNGMGLSTASTLTYSGGRSYFGSTTDRRFAGFAQVTRTEADGDRSIAFYHQGDASNGGQGEYQDHASKIGRTYRTEQQDSTGKRFAVGITKWDRTDLGNGRSFVFASHSLSQAYDGGNAHKDTATGFTYDASGNPTQVKDWGEVSGSDDGTFTDVADGIVITNTAYATTGGSALKAAPCVVSVVEGSGVLLTESRSYYDGLGLCQVGKGNATKSEKLLIGTGYYASTTAHNAFGLPTVTTDWKSNATTIAYDANNLYPSTVTNALGHVVTTTVDLATGQVKETTDPNGAKTRNTYDGLGRITKVEVSDPASPAAWKTARTIAYTDAALPLRVTEKKFNGINNDPGIEEITYSDGFGNPLQVRSTAEGSNQYSVVSRTYDANFRLLKEMLPVYQSGSAYTAPVAADRGNQFTYDALGRVMALSNALGTITTTYAPWKTEVTDANGHKKSSYTDGRGNTVKVEETNGTATYSTTYVYDLLKRLTKITDAENNIRDYAYDSLGRLLSQNMLHAPGQSTASYGSWTYTYDANDSVLTKTDPKGQIISYAYDALNRLKTEDFAGTAGVEVTNTYDTGTYGKGRLTSVVSQGITTAYGYDLLGRTTGTTWTVDAVARTQTATYDLLGNPRTVTYPNGKTVTMTYNNAYQPTTVKQGADTLVSNVDYAPTGAVTRIDFGNGTGTVNSYDIAQLYRLTGKVTTKGATRYQDLSYAYDPVGNITQVMEAADTAAKRTVDYTYDDLDRLISASYGSVTNGMTSASALAPNPSPDFSISQPGKPGAATGDSRASVLRSKTATQSLSKSAPSLAAATGTVDIGVMKTDGRSTISLGDWNTYSLAVTNYGSVRAEYAYVYDLLPSHYDPATTVVSCAACSYIEGNGTAEAYAEMALDPGQSITVSVNAQVRPNQSGTISNTAQSGYWDGGVDANPANDSSTDTTAIGTIPTPTPTPSSAQIFTYSPTGNMLSSGLGTYLYEQTGNANPQAVTKVSNNRTYAYDKNGNLVSSVVASVANAYTYDYRDRMTKSKKGTAADIVYQYDHGWNRVKKWDKNGNKVNLYFGDYEMEGTGSTAGKLTTVSIARINVALGGGQAISLEYDAAGTLMTKAFHHTDHLTGSSIETDANGNLLQTLDYHPYGAVHVNGKTGTYDNKKKFTGKELDSESGLTYFGARYYDADIGRWMGWDPIQQDPATLLKSGELNGYGYVKNNPINGVDPDGLLTIMIHGTDLDGNGPGGKESFETAAGQEYQQRVKELFGETPTLLFWSGGNNEDARSVAANQLAALINNHAFAEGEKLNIVGHSHGGNVALEASYLINRSIDVLITLGTPVRNDYSAKEGMISRHIQAFSYHDNVQIWGGYNVTKKYIGEKTDQDGRKSSGRFNDYESCSKAGYSCRPTSEKGVAGRHFSNAENLNVSKQTSNWPLQSHSDLWQSSKVWEKIKTKFE